MISPRSNPVLCFTLAAGLAAGCLAPPQAASQDPLVPDEIRAAFDERAYDDVVDLAESFLAEYPQSPAVMEVRYLAGEACWKLERYGDSERFLAPVVLSEVSAPRWPQAALLLSRSLEKQREFYRAALWLSELLSEGGGERTMEDAEDILEDLIEDSLTAEELNYIAFRYPASSMRCEVLEKAAKVAAEAERLEELWDLVGLAFPGCADKEKKTWDRMSAAAARTAPIGRCRDPYLVGLACALDGPYAEYGASMQRGVMLALDEYNQTARFKIGLASRDTGGDPIVAVAVGRELATEDGVVCLIGGLLSSTTIALSGVASALGIPLISPSATREEITTAGKRVYQSTLPRRLQARALALAARTRLNAETAAVLYPETEDGGLVGSSFQRAFAEAGGKVVLSSAYLEGETNFSRVLSATSAKSPDCLLLAGSGRDLTPLIPQLSYFGLDVPVLAMESIGAGGIAELARRHLDRVLYAPDAYSLSGETLLDFERRFEEKNGVSPDQFAVKGYLAFKVLCGAFEGGVRTRSEVAERLDGLVADDPNLAAMRFLSMTNIPGVEVPVLELIPQE